MKRTGARAADRKGSRDAEKTEPKVELLNVTFEQIEDRAFTKTEVLVDILERPEGHYLRHWGLNE